VTKLNPGARLREAGLRGKVGKGREGVWTYTEVRWWAAAETEPLLEAVVETIRIALPGVEIVEARRLGPGWMKTALWRVRFRWSGSGTSSVPGPSSSSDSREEG
jgi:hypothetical protein